MHHQPALRIKNGRIRALAARYRGCCVTCGGRDCRCGDARIGLFEPSRDSITPFGYDLRLDRGRLEYVAKPAELAIVRRVFGLYCSTKSITATARQLRAEGVNARREWCSRILRCDLHEASGVVSAAIYSRSQSLLGRGRQR